MTSTQLATLRDKTKDGIATGAQLRGAGFSANAIASRCRPGGPWRRLLPGVIQLGGGRPTRQQLVRAALAHAGGDAVVTGRDALRAQGVEVATTGQVRILVPAHRRLLPQEFVALERTARMPEPVRDAEPAFAPAQRAALDAARRESDPERLRQLLTLPVYYGLCTTAQLRDELEAGNQRGSAAVRAALQHLGDLTETCLHGNARELLRTAPLPPPSWHVTVCDRRGRPIDTVDAWWDGVAVAWKFTADESAASTSDLALTAAGVVVVRTPPRQLRDNPSAPVRELGLAFRRAANRTRPRMLTRRQVAA